MKRLSAKLLDVGHARRIADPLRGWPGPTVAPERVLWHEVPSHGRVNADVYAAAATLTILLTGIDLGEHRARALAALPAREAVLGTARVRLRDVVERGLDPDPARRYQSAQELIAPCSRLPSRREGPVSDRLTLVLRAVTGLEGDGRTIARAVDRRAGVSGWRHDTASDATSASEIF